MTSVIPKIVVAIPCYSCAKQIPRVLEGFKDAQLLSKINKILVIDNQSPDLSAEAAKEAIQRFQLSAKAEIIRNDQNYGLGGTHKVAFLYGENHGFDYVAILHGDAQAKTEELSLLIEEALKNPHAAAILGARFMSASRLRGYSKLRTYGNRMLNMLYTLLSFRKTYDLGSGINLFRVKELKNRRFLSFADAFTFNMDLLLDYYRQKMKVVFVPITWSETDQVSNARTFRVGWITLVTLLRWRLRARNTTSTSNKAYSSKVIYPQ